MVIKAITNLNRFKEVVLILMKYGFDDMVHRLDLPGKGIARKISRVDPEIDVSKRIRLAVEDLGPTFVKFGQIMSMRSDILPSDLIRELLKLQDEVAPEPFTDICSVVEENISEPMAKFFPAFDDQPLAAASLSQVHRAVLRETGGEVAVKVQRPNIRGKISTDLDILAFIVERLHNNIAELQLYDLPELVDIVRRNLKRELDFSAEARFMKIARVHLEDFENVYVPEPLNRHCTERMLVMEYIDGLKIKALTDLESDNARRLARQGLRVAVKQILEDGFFHADPHPGNILIKNQQTLCLLDWGMVGRLTQEDRFDLIDLLQAVVERDGQRLVEIITRIAAGPTNLHTRQLERDLLDILDVHFIVSLNEMRIGRLLMDITDLLRQYRLRIPPELFVMIKALVTAEGTARLLDPEINVVSEIESDIQHLTTVRYGPKIFWRGIRSALAGFIAAPRKFPQLLGGIVEKLEEGQLKIRFQHTNLVEFRGTLERTSNRLTLGIIIAAMIIGSSMIITTGIQPHLFGYPAFGLVGYLISGILGMWLVLDILRSRRY
jgi:ubiquinone biosynthesis protein